MTRRRLEPLGLAVRKVIVSQKGGFEFTRRPGPIGGGPELSGSGLSDDPSRGCSARGALDTEISTAPAEDRSERRPFWARLNFPHPGHGPAQAGSTGPPFRTHGSPLAVSQPGPGVASLLGPSGLPD